MAASPTPSPSEPMPIRPPASSPAAIRKPSFSFPIRADLGSRQLSKITSLVADACCPIFFSSLPITSPGVPASTRKQLIPFPFGALLSVTAQATKTPAYGALVIKILEPFSTQLSPSSTAWVDIPAGSEPAPVSVRQKPAAGYSPEQIF